MYVHFLSYKTDLGTSPLHCGQRGSGNGAARGHWAVRLGLMLDFIFEMSKHKEQTHQELYKVYFNGMFMIYLFIF